MWHESQVERTAVPEGTSPCVPGNTAHNLADGERAYRDLKDGGWLGASIDTQDSGGEASMVR